MPVELRASNAWSSRRPQVSGGRGSVGRPNCSSAPFLEFTQQWLSQRMMNEMLAAWSRGRWSSGRRCTPRLGEPSRLAIVDHLTGSDRSPQELQDAVGVPSNLLAHHLDVLEAAGLIERSRSSGDGRRRYVHLLHDQIERSRSPASDRSVVRCCSCARRTRHAHSSPPVCGLPRPAPQRRAQGRIRLSGCTPGARRRQACWPRPRRRNADLAR